MDSNDKDQQFKAKLVAHINKLVTPLAEDDFTETLENLNALLISSNYRQIRDVSSQMDLGQLFHLFNTAPDELFSDQFVNAFSMFLEALPGNEIFVKYYDSILEGLTSVNIQVVELWLKRIVKPVFVNESLLKSVAMASSININSVLRCAVRLLTSQVTAIASIAHDICVIAAKAFRQEFFSPFIQDELKRIKQQGEPNMKIDKDTLKIRISEVCIDIACTNQLLMDLIKAAGHLSEVTKEFEENISNDPLVALNMIKLITDLASQPHGLEYLRTSTTILPSMAKRIEDIDIEDLYGVLLLPGFINFFIRIAEFDLNVLDEYKVVLNRVMQFIEQDNSNREFLILGIDSLSYICQKNAGKVYVASHSNTQSVLKQIGWLINNGNTELKGRVLIALNGMMEVKDADPGSKANLLTESWYGQLESSGAGLSKFMELAQEPFSELRIPALNFIRILATSVWGQKILANESGFIDYLVDRRSETNKEGRDAKFEIVRELVMSPFIRLSFTPEAILRLRGYFKAGPVDKEVNVAFENAS